MTVGEFYSTWSNNNPNGVPNLTKILGVSATYPVASIPAATLAKAIAIAEDVNVAKANGITVDTIRKEFKPVVNTPIVKSNPNLKPVVPAKKVTQTQKPVDVMKVPEQPNRLVESWNTIVNDGLGAFLDQTINYFTEPEKNKAVEVEAPQPKPATIGLVTSNVDSNIVKKVEAKPVVAIGDTIHNYGGNRNRFIVPLTVDLEQAKVGVRNRYDLHDLQTSGAVFTTYKKFYDVKSVEKYNFNKFIVFSTKGNNVKVIDRNEVEATRKEHWNTNDILLTGTYAHKVKSITGSGITNPGIGVKSMAYQSPDGKNGQVIVFGYGDGNKLGGYYGGKVIVTTPDNKHPHIIYGTGNQVKQEVEEYKKRFGVDWVYLLEADGKAYAQTIQTKNKVLKGQDLNTLDNLNSASAGSGNIIYLK